MNNEEKILTILEQLQQGQARTDVRLDKIDTRLDGIDTRLDKIESDIVEIKEQIINIDESIGAIADWADVTATVTKIPFAGGSTSIG